MINAGYGNYVAKDKIIAVVSPESAPVKRMIKAASERGTLIDVTMGRKTKSVIITKDFLILSANLTKALMGRITGEKEI